VNSAADVHPTGEVPGTVRRGPRWPSALVGLVVLGAGALAVTAVVRSIIGVSGPILPYSICRSGHLAGELPPLTGSRVLTSWQFAPLATGLALVAAVLYAGGLRRVGASARAATWPAWRIGSFYAGLGVLLVAVSSSIAVYDMSQFWCHMIQHLMLIMAAPALLVIGRPLTLVATVSDARGGRTRRILRSWPVLALTSPGVALGAYAAAIVGAHLTGLTDDVLSNVWSSQIEHLVYLAVGVLFFWLVYGDEPIPWQLSMPGRVLLLIVAMAVDTFVGVVLLESTKPLDTIAHPGWGLNPIDDLQAGGAIMWVGGDGLMAVMAIALYVAWARRPAETRKASVFERVRTGLQAERTTSGGATSRAGANPAAAPGSIPLPAPTSDAMDTDDRELEAYNRWLADLHRRG
jgi:cytochrome c oxidase assembly factor CtaG